MSITVKSLEIDMRLLLSTNRKSYMGSPAAPLGLTFSDLEGQIQFGRLIALI